MDERVADIYKVLHTQQVKELGTQERLAIEATLENYPEGSIHRICSFVNGDFTDEEDVPSGLLTVHPVDAQVHPDSLPREMFQYTVVVPIMDQVNKPDGYTDVDFQGKDKEQALHEAAPEHSSNPVSLEHRDANTNLDQDTWRAQLGGAEGFAGVFKEVKGNGRDASYFIVAQAGAPEACQQFKQNLIKKPKTTFAQLLEDPEYNYVKYVAKRNAERLAYNVARALKVPITHTKDVGAYAKTVFSAQPMRAVPRYSQALSSIQPIAFKGQPAIGIFHKVRPKMQVNDFCMVNAGPYEGLVLFNMNGNAKGYGLPADVGRNAGELRTLPQKEIRARARGITWEGKTDQSLAHPQLHPDAFRPIDNAFLDSLKDMGWSQTGLANRRYLVPVLVKIASQ
jgi:hypothetical protein